MLKRSFGLSLILGLVLALAVPVLAAAQNNSVKVGNDLEVPAGAVVDSAVTVGGSVTVAGQVREDVVAIGGSVYLKDTAVVGGGVTSIGGSVVRDPKAQVAGEITEVTMPGMGTQTGKTVNLAALLQAFKKMFFFFGFMGFVTILLTVIVLVALFTTQIGLVSYTVEKNFWLTLFTGLLAAFVFVPGIFLLLFTVVGIIFIPVWVILYAAAKIFGLVAVAHLIGKQILKAFKVHGKPMILEALMGALILYLFAFVPFLNFIVLVIAALCGIGAVVVSRFGTAKA